MFSMCAEPRGKCPAPWCPGLTAARIKHVYEPVLSMDELSKTWQHPTNALPIPARFTSAREPLHVVARVCWPKDGTEYIVTLAWAWTLSSVLVQLDDVRLRVRGVWLPPGDIKRRA